MRDALLGGSANFAADREAADEISAVLPGGADTATFLMEAIVDFRCRVVRHLVADAGLRQLVQLGTGAPTGRRMTHEVAQEIAPDCRVLHCIDDTVALAHAHELHGRPEGAVGFIHGTLDNPGHLLAQAAQTLDLDEPVGVVATWLSVIPDHEDPWSATAELLAGLTAGSYLMVAQLGNDIRPDLYFGAGERHQKLVAAQRMRPLCPRSRADVERFFDDLELLEPGVVPVELWRPEGSSSFLPDDLATPFYGAVGRSL